MAQDANKRPTAPQPQHGESYDSYVVRAHYALMAEVSDVNQRNQIVWQTWERFTGDATRAIADQQFAATGEYVKKDDVCYFFENETVQYDAQGQPIVTKYDPATLAEMANEINNRISQHSNYPTLLDSHTPIVSVPGKVKEQPRTLGYIGPMRLGMIGDRFGLYAPEYRRKDRLAEIKDRPQRSAEVLRLKANNRPFIGAVAAISETPRLPLPTHFAASAEDDEAELVAIYSMDSEKLTVTATLPGGMNTHVAQFGATAPNKPMHPPQAPAGGSPPPSSPPAAGSPPAANDSPQKPEADNDGGNFAEGDIRKIVQAIAATPPFQFLQDLMNAAGGDPTKLVGGGSGLGQPGQGQPGQGQGDLTPAQQTPNPAHAAPPHAPPAAPAAQQHNAPNMPVHGAPAPTAPQAPPQMQPDKYAGLPTRYSADEAQEVSMDSSEFVTVEQYSALRSSMDQAFADIAALREENVKLAKDRADAVRREQIRNLHSQFPVVDVEKEISRCCYSAGSQMDDHAFAAHIEMVAEYAQKAVATSPMIPKGELPVRQTSVEQQQYSVELSERTRQIFNTNINAGKYVSYDDCVRQAKEQLTANTQKVVS